MRRQLPIRLLVCAALAGSASAEIAPVPVHPVMVWDVALPVRVVQVTLRGDAEAIPPGIATAASDADPASAAQTRSRMGS